MTNLLYIPIDIRKKKVFCISKGKDPIQTVSERNVIDKTDLEKLN